MTGGRAVAALPAAAVIPAILAAAIAPVGLAIAQDAAGVTISAAELESSAARAISGAVLVAEGRADLPDGVPVTVRVLLGRTCVAARSADVENGRWRVRAPLPPGRVPAWRWRVTAEVRRDLLHPAHRAALPAGLPDRLHAETELVTGTPEDRRREAQAVARLHAGRLADLRAARTRLERLAEDVAAGTAAAGPDGVFDPAAWERLAGPWHERLEHDRRRHRERADRWAALPAADLWLASDAAARRLVEHADALAREWSAAAGHDPGPPPRRMRRPPGPDARRHDIADLLARVEDGIADLVGAGPADILWAASVAERLREHLAEREDAEAVGGGKAGGGGNAPDAGAVRRVNVELWQARVLALAGAGPHGSHRTESAPLDRLRHDRPELARLVMEAVQATAAVADGRTPDGGDGDGSPDTARGRMAAARAAIAALERRAHAPGND